MSLPHSLCLCSLGPWEGSLQLDTGRGGDLIWHAGGQDSFPILGTDGDEAGLRATCILKDNYASHTWRGLAKTKLSGGSEVTGACWKRDHSRTAGFGEKEPKQMNSRVSLRSPSPPSWPQTPECSPADASKVEVRSWDLQHTSSQP